MCRAMARTAASAVAGQQGLDDRQVLAGFLGEPAVVVAASSCSQETSRKARNRIFSRPSSLARKALPHEAAIRSCSRLSTARASSMKPCRAGRLAADQPPQGLAARRAARPGRSGRRPTADGLAFQDAADLADLADLAGGDAADDRPAVGQQVDDADARQGDQRLADRRVADAEALGQLLGDQVLPGPEPALEDVGQQRLDDRLPAQAMIALQQFNLHRDRHGTSSVGTERLAGRRLEIDRGRDSIGRLREPRRDINAERNRRANGRVDCCCHLANDSRFSFAFYLHQIPAATKICRISPGFYRILRASNLHAGEGPPEGGRAADAPDDPTSRRPAAP